MPARIKICGVTLPGDAARIAAAGADFIGLNFWPRSKRYLAPPRAPVIAAAARGACATPGGIAVVGVFVNARVDDIAAIARAATLDVIQLHGDETADDVLAVARATRLPVWKAVAAAASADVAGLDRWPVDAILLDAPTAGRGGGGRVFDWQLAREARRLHPDRKLLLAGGLEPGNVAAAVAAVDPWAVDVASGVESAPGIKDLVKVAAFLAAARGWPQ